MSIDMAQFHQVFFEESFEGLDIMESGLLEMQPGEVDSEEINSIFRAAHSIKGGAGTFGFNDVAGFTHIMETLLDEMRDGRRDVTTEASEALLKSVDVLRDMLNACQDGEEADQQRVKQQQSELERILANDAPAGTAQAEPTAEAGSSGEKRWLSKSLAGKLFSIHMTTFFVPAMTLIASSVNFPGWVNWRLIVTPTSYLPWMNTIPKFSIFPGKYSLKKL